MAILNQIELPDGATYDIPCIYTVKGTQTSSTASWTGNIDVDALYDGLVIAYYLPVASKSSTNVTLNLTLKDGTTTGAVAVYVTGETRLTTHYGVGSTIYLTYWSAGSISISGTPTTAARWTGSEYYISNTDTKVRQTLATGDSNRPLLLSYSANTVTTSNVDNVCYRNNSIYANPSSGIITATGFAGDLTGNADTATTAGNVTGTVAIANGGTGATSAADALTNLGAAASSHTHTTTIATSTGTNQITLSHGGKYALTAGGTSYIFTMPDSGNTDRYVNSAAFADDTSANSTSPVKMTLTRAGSDTATVTANIPKVSSTSAGVAPKGAAVSSQSQSTKFLREDGSWAAPSYTTNTNTTYTFANGTNGFTVTPSGGSAQTVTVTPSITNNVTGSGTSGYIAKFNGAHTITNGPAFGSATTTYLRNDGSWATPTDTKNTAGSTDTSSKIFLVGATSQDSNPQTYSDNEVYTTSGVLTTKSIQIGGGSATIQYNSTDECIDFIFA